VIYKLGTSAYIVAIIGHPHLGADHSDLAIVDDDPAVVIAVLVCHGPVGQLVGHTEIMIDAGYISSHADIADYIPRVLILKDLG
jgi:hypothetical protein